MRHPLFLFLLVLPSLLLGSHVSTTARAEAKPRATHQLRLATLAPTRSPLGRGFQQLRRELRELTNGDVELKMYHGGAAGDETTVVRKMRVGQLDGALLTSTGLGALVPQVMVLQAPGVIRDYTDLDKVRKELEPELNELFDKNGYKLVSWGDSGRIRIYSKHTIEHPDDLRKVRPWVWRGSPTMKAFIEAAGANGVKLNLPEVYSALQTGMLDTVVASSIGVLAFQWHTRLKTMTKPGGGVVVGAYVIKKDRLAALPEVAREHILQSAHKHAEDFRKGGRKLDRDASRALAKRLKVVDLSHNKDAWDVARKKARKTLAGRLYSKALLRRVEEIVGRN